VHYDQKLRFPNEIRSTLRVIWCFVKYLVFQSKIPVFAQYTRYLLRKSQFSFAKSGICSFVTFTCHTYPGHFILPYNIRNRPTCLKGLEIYMKSVYSWHKNGMFFWYYISFLKNLLISSSNSIYIYTLWLLLVIICHHCIFP
jgi:hypothetical protein